MHCAGYGMSMKHTISDNRIYVALQLIFVIAVTDQSHRILVPYSYRQMTNVENQIVTSYNFLTSGSAPHGFYPTSPTEFNGQSCRQNSETWTQYSSVSPLKYLTDTFP